MRAVGLITEYNPFHRGHLHHLRESLRGTGADVAVAVMSGHFLQRGEPALVDKWVRTEMALAAGVDVVVELPFPFACNSAPHFARGAIQVLDALGGIDALCFGSESGELAPLARCADLLVAQGEEIERRTARLLRQGLAYPGARARVIGELGSPAAAAVLATPNNILGVEYLRALRLTGSTIVPFTIPRLGAGYHDREATGAIASATGIRAMIAAGEGIDGYLPPVALPPFRTALAAGATVADDHLHRLLLARIARGPDSLAGLYQVEHGLGQRLCAAAPASTGFADLAAAVKGRHLTLTRVQRLLCHLLIEATAAEIAAALAAGPRYLHLLGASDRGRQFLAAGRKRRTLPLVQNYSRIHAILKRRYGPGSAAQRQAEESVRTELRATQIHTLLWKCWPGGNRQRDFFEEVRGR